MPTTSAGVCATSPRGTGTPYRAEDGLRLVLVDFHKLRPR